MVRTEGQLSGLLQETGGLPLPALSLPLTSLGAQASARTPGLLRAPGHHTVARGVQEEKCTTSPGGSRLHTEERARAALRGAQGVLVYSIKPSLMLTFLWTKAFTLETPSVFLPIIIITEHVIPFLLFFFPSFDLSAKSCFLCSPGHSAPPSPGHLWETYTGTHGLYCKASLKARKKNRDQKVTSAADVKWSLKTST